MFSGSSRTLWVACGVFFTILCLARLRPAAAGIIVDSASGHGYEFVVPQLGLDWDTARLDAMSRTYLGVAGHLATITSAEENSFIATNITDQYFAHGQYVDDIWIGGHQAPNSVEPRGGWSWVTGEAFSYTAWDTYEPNNSFNTENAIVLRWANATGGSGSGLTWNDLTDTWSRSAYLVEYDTHTTPEPSSLIVWSSFGMSGLVAALRSRRRKAA